MKKPLDGKNMEGFKVLRFNNGRPDRGYFAIRVGNKFYNPRDFKRVYPEMASDVKNIMSEIIKDEKRGA